MVRTAQFVRAALALVACATVLAVSAPASAAAPVGATGRNTEGIDRSAHSVTTHAGTVVTGITFVDERDVARIRQQQAGAVRPQFGGTLFCLPDWHYITGGGTNTYWKPAGSNRAGGNLLPHQLTADLPSNDTQDNFSVLGRVYVCDYDRNWIYLEGNFGGVVSRDPGTASVFTTGDAQLTNGNELFKVDPPLGYIAC